MAVSQDRVHELLHDADTLTAEDYKRKERIAKLYENAERFLRQDTEPSYPPPLRKPVPPDPTTQQSSAHTGGLHMLCNAVAIDPHDTSRRNLALCLEDLLTDPTFSEHPSLKILAQLLVDTEAEATTGGATFVQQQNTSLPQKDKEPSNHQHHLPQTTEATGSAKEQTEAVVVYNNNNTPRLVALANSFQPVWPTSSTVPQPAPTTTGAEATLIPQHQQQPPAVRTEHENMDHTITSQTRQVGGGVGVHVTPSTDVERAQPSTATSESSCSPTSSSLHLTDLTLYLMESLYRRAPSPMDRAAAIQCDRTLDAALLLIDQEDQEDKMEQQLRKEKRERKRKRLMEECNAVQEILTLLRTIDSRGPIGNQNAIPLHMVNFGRLRPSDPIRHTHTVTDDQQPEDLHLSTLALGSQSDSTLIDHLQQLHSDGIFRNVNVQADSRAPHTTHQHQHHHQHTQRTQQHDPTDQSQLIVVMPQQHHTDFHVAPTTLLESTSTTAPTATTTPPPPPTSKAVYSNDDPIQDEIYYLRQRFLSPLRTTPNSTLTSNNNTPGPTFTSNNNTTTTNNADTTPPHHIKSSKHVPVSQQYVGANNWTTPNTLLMAKQKQEVINARNVQIQALENDIANVMAELKFRPPPMFQQPSTTF